MTDLIILLLIAAIVGGATFYIYRQKRRGVRCVGCPDAKTCSGACGGCNCGCGMN